jgi:hypothetical protein
MSIFVRFGTLLAKYCIQQKQTVTRLFQRGIIMGKMRENPRYNVVSMRISDDERIELENLMSVTDKSVSGIMREAMQLFKARLDSLHMEGSAA